MNAPLNYLLAVVALFSLLQFQCPGAFPGNLLLNQERKQQRIKDTTQRTAEQLDSLIDEFNRNGLQGSDVQVIKAIRQVLGQLSKEQMKEIVNLLNGAREDTKKDPNSTGASVKILNAYAGQKGVIVQLRRILLEYQSQVALFDLARLVRELGNRQTTNLHEAISLASSASFNPGSPTRSEQISLQLQSAEQEALGGEVATVVNKLKDLSKLTAGSPDQRPTKALQYATETKLNNALQKAVDEIKGKRVMSAVSFEKKSRDSLWKLAKILEPEKGELEQMVEALERLEDIIDKESEIEEQTEKLDKEDKKKISTKDFPLHIQKRIEQLEKGIRFSEFNKEARIKELQKVEKIEQNALNSQELIASKEVEKAKEQLDKEKEQLEKAKEQLDKA
ncbi:MAG: hypothetical protein MK172_07730, partial [Verrucomicrobiales bacterium]|nr:hypothetical protein [Verrucomicrobiales bacterium]